MIILPITFRVNYNIQNFKHLVWNKNVNITKYEIFFV